MYTANATASLLARRLALFPLTTAIAPMPGDGRTALTIGGCDLRMLAAEHGTPFYCFDAATLDAAAQAYQSALARHYPGESAVTYAGKAYLSRAMAQWTQRRQLWVDCTGAGEIGIAVAAGVPRAHILVHGVNKSDADLDAATAHAAIIVVDNLAELQRLTPRLLATENPPSLWLRVRPGVAVDTHAYRQTGQEDSKFGMSPQEIMEAVHHCLRHGLALHGLHFHQGSHFHDPTPIGPALEIVLDLAAELASTTGWQPRALSPGGGWGVAYHEDDLPQPDVDEYVRFIALGVVAGCRRRGLALPTLHLEPGRSLVARAGVAVYTVGAIKQTATRRWLFIDGGMADNPRPALYGARYSALPVLAPERAPLEPAWIAGPYCESGDILIEALPMPAMEAGEMLAIPVSGAYHLAMQSNYNGARKPAVLWLDAGRAQLIQRRETIADLLTRDADLVL
ncbi:MAG TPA: diaminopimelate decarboxylase [Chloroflexi bacterium]|nr:diaminopimelate decarboxylase [Chloroflexota bacterium]HHW87754.1 diaminopimelate decarboxylase [Chloroflexota bacterium]